MDDLNRTTHVFPRLVFSMLVCLFVSLNSLGGTYQPKVDGTDAHTLTEKLRQTKGKDRLPIIKELSNLSWNKPEEEKWLLRLYQEGIKLGSYSAADEAVAELSNYYYNNNQVERLKWCSAQSESIAKKTGKYSDEYFTVMFFDCQRDVWDGHYTTAIRHAKTFYRKAEQSRNHTGIIRFNELMGLLFQMMGKNGTAEAYLTKGLAMSEKYYPEDYYHNTQLLSVLVEVQLEQQPLDSAYASLQRLERLQRDISRGKYGNHAGFPLERNRRLICAYYMSYYNKTKQYNKTVVYMSRAASCKQSDVYVDYLINVASSRYYNAVHNYPMALEKINQVLIADDTATVDFLKFKADILSKTGQKDEAIHLYQQCYKLQQDKRSQQFDTEVARLQNMYSNLLLQLHLKQAEMNNEKSNRRMLIFALLFAIAAFVAMAGFAFYRGKVGRQLRKDKEDLAETGEALKKALAKADETNRLKDSFMHNISHEIRTPLNSIVGFSRLIVSQASGNPDYAEFLVHIEKNTDALLSVVNNMMDLAMYQSNHFSLTTKEDVNLSAICRETISFLKLSGKLNEQVKVSYSGTPENYTLHTSTKLLKIILNHLLINSAKFTTSGYIQVDYAVRSAERQVQFTVTDTGSGISPENYDTIFESFEKGGSFAQGMGLGLTICRELIRKLGGEIRLDTTYKDGARFIFTHPIA